MIPRVHTRGLLDGGAGAQLVVHGKGGKERVVPISDSLAGAIRAGAAGHTLAESSSGWLFPGDTDGHLSPHWVGQLCDACCPMVGRLTPCATDLAAVPAEAPAT